MKKLFDKSEIWFAVIWIIVYLVGSSAADIISAQIGFEKAVTLPFHVILTTVLLIWVSKNGLKEYFGLCKPQIKPSKLLYYIPLVILASCNLWMGFFINKPLAETVCYILSMLCVGILEELIMRGFLFKAMCKDNVKTAIIVSGITFGIGHIVNLFNGSGAELLSNICQVCYAISFGFLFVIIFLKSKSIIPCIITHCVFNSLSVFANYSAYQNETEIIISLILIVISAGYTIFIIKANKEQNPA